jgi:cytochrome P450
MDSLSRFLKIISLQYCLEIVAEERAKKPEERSSWISRLMDRDDDFLQRPLSDLEIAEEIVGAL